MLTAVNLDALIMREDFEIVGEGDEIPAEAVHRYKGA